MEKYIKLKIPFGSKSYIKDSHKGLYLKADAYFIFNLDKKQIIDEYIHIHKANYRITDKALIKPTDHYKNKIVRNFRDNYLDKYYIHNPKEILKTEYKFLTTEQTIEVNKFFRTLNTTIKTMFSLLSGSNISGAETNNNASPIRCIDNQYFDCNFANVVKHYSSSDNDKTKSYPDNIKIYSLNEFINSNIIPGFKNMFYKYNKELLFDENSFSPLYDELNDKRYEPVSKNIKFKLKESQELFIYSLINKSLDNYNEFINDNKKLKNKLRSYFNSNIYYCLKNNLIPLHSTITKYNLSNIDNAHIIQFATCVDKLTYNDIYLAINPFNCLRIDKSTHNLLDKNKIYFDSKGNIFNNKGILLHSKYLDLKNMPVETREIFNLYLEKNNLLD